MPIANKDVKNNNVNTGNLLAKTENTSLLLFVFNRVVLFKFKTDINIGRKIKLDTYVIVRPMHIIRPKSITGLIPLVYSDPNAKIVVKAAKKQGLYIFPSARIIFLLIVDFSSSKLICRYLTTICTVIDKDKIKISMIKFDEITVTFHPSSETDPIIVIKMNIPVSYTHLTLPTTPYV